MSFRVASERCAECLFGSTPVVSAARRREILAELTRKDSHFICHKFTIAGNQDVQCRGDYDRDPMRTNLSRIAHRLGAVEFVDLPNEGDRCMSATAVEEGGEARA